MKTAAGSPEGNGSRRLRSASIPPAEAPMTIMSRRRPPESAFWLFKELPQMESDGFCEPPRSPFAAKNLSEQSHLAVEFGLCPGLSLRPKTKAHRVPTFVGSCK